MKKVTLILALFAVSPPAWAELVSESWGGKPAKDTRFTHPGTLKVVSSGKVPRLVFDLSALPAGAKVYHASLLCPARQPRDPIRIFVTEAVGADGEPTYAPKPLKLEGPRYRSFDATRRRSRP